MKASPQIVLSEGIFNDDPVVFVDFKFDWTIVESLKDYSKANYIRSEKRWYIVKNVFDLTDLKQNLSNKIEIVAVKLKSTIPEGYLALLLQKRYSENTIKTYLHYFKNFIDYFVDKDLDEISTEMINKYILELIERKNISNSQQNQRINAIKFYYEKVQLFSDLINNTFRTI